MFFFDDQMKDQIRLKRYLKQKPALVVEGELVQQLDPLGPLHGHQGRARRVNADVHGGVVLVEDESDGLSVALPAVLRHVLELIRPEKQSVGHPERNGGRQDQDQNPGEHFRSRNSVFG